MPKFWNRLEISNIFFASQICGRIKNRFSFTVVGPRLLSTLCVPWQIRLLLFFAFYLLWFLTATSQFTERILPPPGCICCCYFHFPSLEAIKQGSQTSVTSDVIMRSVFSLNSFTIWIDFAGLLIIRYFNHLLLPT